VTDRPEGARSRARIQKRRGRGGDSSAARKGNLRESSSGMIAGPSDEMSRASARPRRDFQIPSGTARARQGERARGREGEMQQGSPRVVTGGRRVRSGTFRATPSGLVRLSRASERATRAFPRTRRASVAAGPTNDGRANRVETDPAESTGLATGRTHINDATSLAASPRSHRVARVRSSWRRKHGRSPLRAYHPAFLWSDVDPRDSRGTETIADLADTEEH